jgi:hypothetical protein
VRRLVLIVIALVAAVALAGCPRADQSCSGDQCSAPAGGY